VADIATGGTLDLLVSSVRGTVPRQFFSLGGLTRPRLPLRNTGDSKPDRPESIVRKGVAAIWGLLAITFNWRLRQLNQFSVSLKNKDLRPSEHLGPGFTETFSCASCCPVKNKD
jgi:hypothetical protein